jgi:hypothetical protein
MHGYTTFICTFIILSENSHEARSTHWLYEVYMIFGKFQLKETCYS